MLTDPEERKRLRQEKAAQRLRKQAQTKKLLLRLSLAAVVLIACGILIFTLSRKDPSPPYENPSASQETPPTQDPASSETGNPTESADPTETEAPTSTVIHYVAAGDLNINDSTVQAGGNTYDYTNTFIDVAHILSDADIASINFEGNFYGEPYGSTNSAPQTMATALQRAGVDLVQLANSYSINWGLAGLNSSIASVRAAGMEPLGVYATNAEYQKAKGYTIRNVQGIRIAFVAFTKGMDGMALPPGSEHCVNVLYEDYDSVYQTVDTERITSVLSAVQKEKPDLVIALLHWGSEFNDTISASQEEILSLMQSNGVDAIIGTHSHYVQKMSLDAETGKFVAYSLGDFFSDGSRAGSEYSVLLDLEITKDHETGETRITDYSYTPIFSVHEAERPFCVQRIHEAVAAYENRFVDRVSKETYEQMVYALERIEARVAGE